MGGGFSRFVYITLVSDHEADGTIGTVNMLLFNQLGGLYCKITLEVLAFENYVGVFERVDRIVVALKIFIIIFNQLTRK